MHSPVTLEKSTEIDYFKTKSLHLNHSSSGNPCALTMWKVPYVFAHVLAITPTAEGILHWVFPKKFKVQLFLLNGLSVDACEGMTCLEIRIFVSFSLFLIRLDNRETQPKSMSVAMNKCLCMLLNKGISNSCSNILLNFRFKVKPPKISHTPLLKLNLFFTQLFQIKLNLSNNRWSSYSNSCLNMNLPITQTFSNQERNGLRALRNQETRIKSSDELLSDNPMEILYMDIYIYSKGKSIRWWWWRRRRVEKKFTWDQRKAGKR